MPDWKLEIGRRLAPLRLAPEREAPLTDELAQHLDDHYRDLRAGGMPDADARRTALAGLDRHELLRALQPVAPPQQIAPPVPGAAGPFLAGLVNDIRYSLRILRKNPGFTSIAVLTLALGIAANTAIFSVVNSLYLHPPGIVDSDRVVAVRVNYVKLGLKNIEVSPTDFADARDSKQVFQSVAIEQPSNFLYTGGTAPERLLGALVSWRWIDTLGARPILGRTFLETEDVPGANHEVILAYSTWSRLFGKDANIVGKSVVLNDESYRIVGVMGPDFNWPSEAQLWTPLGYPPSQFGPDNRFNENLECVARLAPGITLAQGEAYAAVLTQRLASGNDDAAAYIRSSQWGMVVMPLTELIYGDLRAPMLVLSGAVGFVLLICCANVAGLMLAKASGRARELAIRTALGARRVHLVRQVLVESFLIAGMGTAVGLGLAVYLVRHASAIAPEGSIGGLDLALDRSVLLFTIGAGVLAALLFGLAPAWSIAAAKTFELLKESGRSAMSGKGRQRLRSVLVTAEVALALVLLVGAGLFVKSLIRIQQLSPGFDPRGVMTGSLSLDPHAYGTPEKRQAFFVALTQRLAAQPGVDAAAVVFPLPFSGTGGSSSFTIEGRALGPGDPGPHSDISAVSPGFFRALSIPLRAGRYFTDDDRLDTEPVAIIDDNLARQYWPGQDPIGARIRRGRNWTRIVGVVAHSHRSSLEADTGKGLAYYPILQLSVPMAHLVARTSSDPAAVSPSMREAMRAADASQVALYDLKPLEERVSASLGPRRFAVTMLTAFATFALFLSALGLYGVISYAVALRTQEIGIRMALGARISQVLAMVLREALRLVLTGIALGLMAALALARVLRSELLQVSAFDPLTFAAMSAVLVLVTLAATYVPARRASKVDPMIALRYE